MDISSSLAARAYDTTKSAAKPDPSAKDIGAAAENFAKVLEKGESTAKAVMAGNADPHSLVEALAQSQIAVETAVAVRDKVVEAYQEILRMPV